MNQKDLDIYLNNFTNYEYELLENFKRIYNFKDIDETIENFDLIKNEFLEPISIYESGYPQKIFFKKHDRFIQIANHKHNYIEMAYIYSGKIDEIVDGKSITLKKGDLIIFDTNVIHAINIAGINDIMLNFSMDTQYFNNTFFERLCSNNIISNFILHAIYENHKYNSYIIFHTHENEFIHSILCKLAIEFISPSLSSTALIDSCIISLFAELVVIYDTQNKNEEELNLNKQIKLSLEILNYISSNYQTISLSSAAKHFNFNPNYFSALVKSYTGKNLKDLILDEKLKKASYLLRNTALSVSEISEEAGFTNINFFYKKFKEKYFMTPKKYRI